MKNTFWNVIISTLATAILGVLGYVLITLNAIQQNEAAQNAVDFNSRDASLLQRELTDIMTDIDIRLRLIERDIHWLRGGYMPLEGSGPEPEPMPPPAPPRYKIDSVKQEAQEAQEEF